MRSVQNSPQKIKKPLGPSDMRPEEFIQQPLNVKKETKVDYLKELRQKNQRYKEVEELPDDFSELENKIDDDRQRMAESLDVDNKQNLTLIKLKADQIKLKAERGDMKLKHSSNAQKDMAEQAQEVSMLYVEAIQSKLALLQNL